MFFFLAPFFLCSAETRANICLRWKFYFRFHSFRFERISGTKNEKKCNWIKRVKFPKRVYKRREIRKQNKPNDSLFVHSSKISFPRCSAMNTTIKCLEHFQLIVELEICKTSTFFKRFVPISSHWGWTHKRTLVSMQTNIKMKFQTNRRRAWFVRSNFVDIELLGEIHVRFVVHVLHRWNLWNSQNHKR